jgi:hypothetical protein
MLAASTVSPPLRLHRQGRSVSRRFPVKQGCVGTFCLVLAVLAKLSAWLEQNIKSVLDSHSMWC